MIRSNYISPDTTQLWIVEKNILCESTGFATSIDDTVEVDDFAW